MPPRGPSKIRASTIAFDSTTQTTCSHGTTATMALDVRHVMFNVEVMLQLSYDLATALDTCAVQLPIVGDDPLECQADPTVVVARLRSYTHSTPVWVLQWTFLIAVYASETVVQGVKNATPSVVFNQWYYGKTGEGGTLASFDTRMEHAITGTYMPKTKRGSRKLINREALTPLEITVSEVLLVHTIRSM